MARLLAALAVLGAVLTLTAGASASRIYAPDYGSGPPEVIEGFESAADGSLAPLPGSPFAVGQASPTPAVGGMIGLAFTPEGGRAVSSFLFFGGAQGLAVGADGAIAPAGDPATSPSVTGLAVSPDGRFAYTATRDFSGTAAVGIVGYLITAGGALVALDDSPFGSGEFGDVAITPDGRFLYAAAGAGVKRFAIAADGGLTELAPTSISAVARSLQVSPDGRLLFVGASSAPATVTSYTIAADGSVTQNGDPAPAGGSSLAHFAVSPDGRHVYMPESNSGTVATAAVGGDGALSVIDSMAIENTEVAAVSPDGRFLYLQVGGGQIAVASLGADGKPTLLPFTTPFDSGEPVRMLFQPQPAPTAAVTAAPAFPGAAVSFDAGGSTRAARYDWDFGDGTTLADGGPTPQHTYAQAGIYTARVTVTDAQGCSARQVYTGQSTVCPGGDAAGAAVVLDTLPVLGPLSLTNRRFAVPPVRRKRVKRGTRLGYTLSEAAAVAFTIERRRIGRLVEGTCRAKRRRNRRLPKCVRFKRAGGFTTAAQAGANETRFSGRLGGRKLRTGRYRVTAVATDAAGGDSVAQVATFRVVRGGRRKTAR